MDPDTLDQRTEEMIRRRVAGGANEAESRSLLAEFLTTAGKGFLPTALHYNGFATARAAETFTEAYFAPTPSGGAAAGSDATAADITVEHSAEGTLVHGTTRGDQETAQALKANGFRWSRNLDAWYLPRNLTHETRDQRVAALQGALGDRIEVEIPDGGRRLTAAEKDTAKRERAADRAERMNARADKLQAKADTLRAETERFFENVPLGQPNIVDTSAGRAFTRKREKMHAKDWKAHETAQAAAGARAAADRAEQTATGTDSVVTITNRIERNEALVRKVDRELTGHETAQRIIDKVGADHPKVAAVGTTQLGIRSPERLAQLGELKAEALDAIAHDRTLLEAAGGVTYGTHNVRPGDVIVTGPNRYTPVLRANAKSATVPTGYTWTDTLPWAKVTKVIEAETFTPDQVRQLLEHVDPDDKHRISAFQKTLARAEAAAESAASAPASSAESGTPRQPEVTYVPVSYQHVDFAQMPDGTAHRLTYDDTNPYALHAEIHAISDDKQIGKVHWTPGYGNATVEVDPDHRRQGIGTRLMREAMATDPTAAQRWTPVTAAGQALGDQLGLDVAGREQPIELAHAAPTMPESPPRTATWSREEASLLEGLDVDAAARQRLDGRQGHPQPTTAATPSPGVSR